MGKNQNLVDCAENGDLIGVKKALRNRSQGLITKKSDINYKHDIHGSTALHIASSKGYVEIVLYLVEKGAEINITDRNGRTPLHRACESSCFDIVTILVEHDVNINLKDHEGRTALHKICAKGGFSIACFLIQKGADITDKDDEGRTPLHWSSFVGFLDITNLLLEKGAYIEEKDKALDARTPLHLAAKAGFTNIVKHLVNKGADIEAKDSGNRNPYQLGISNHKNDVCKYLLEVHTEREQVLKANAKSLSKESLYSSSKELFKRENSYTSRDLQYSIGGGGGDPSRDQSMISIASDASSYRVPAWVPDHRYKNCMICQKKFTMFFRRHHCRRCGVLVCRYCAPNDNMKIIQEYGYNHPVRHCKLCYKSPKITIWKQQPQHQHQYSTTSSVGSSATSAYQ